MSSRWTLSLTLGLITVVGTARAKTPASIVAAHRPTPTPSSPSGPRNPNSCPPKSNVCQPPFLVGPVPYGYYWPPVVIVPGGVYFGSGSPVSYGPSMVPLASPDPGFGVAGPLPPREMADQWPGPPAKKAKRSDPARADQLVTVGDRLFRAGNPRRAAERYEQAARADPNAAAPHIALAQLALGRGEYAEAAGHIREALTVEPGWLIHAPDISATYGEPAEFSEQIARLESHLQARPTDRDAWLVLGAQWYLSGQTKKAADVFLRLTDRKADVTLEAFLDASASKNQEE